MSISNTSIRRALALTALCATIGGPFNPARAKDGPVDAPVVAVTIKPVASLVAMVMRGVGAPSLIIPGAASPHTYALKPSTKRLIDGAALVVWVGPTLESALAKPLHQLEDKGRALTLLDAPRLTHLPAREGGVWDVDEHDHGHHDHGEGHADGDHDDEIDPHLWLDTRNAVEIVGAVAERLATIDPGHAATYRANAATAASELTALGQELAQTLAPVTKRPFIVFHDAYQYMERAHGLTAVGSITVDPGREPSAKRLSQLRAKIKAGGAACVFVEPQFPPKLANTVVEGTGARIGTLDPLGLDAAPAAVDGGHYPAMMRAMAASLVTCLTP